jgi:hypothetical protein
MAYRRRWPSHAVLCSLDLRSFRRWLWIDHWFCSNAEQARALMSRETVVVAQPDRISGGIGSSAARHRADCGLEDRMIGKPRTSAPPSAFTSPLALR